LSNKCSKKPPFFNSLLAMCRTNNYKELRKDLRSIFVRTVGWFEAGTIYRYSELAKEPLNQKRLGLCSAIRAKD